MKNKKLLSMGIFFMLIFAVVMISAQVEYFQTLEDKGNNTILNHIFYCYYNNVGFQPNISNYVSGSNFLETYIYYNVYIQKWNTANPSYKIDWCNLAIKQSTGLSNPSVLFNITYTLSDFDVLGAKYFLKMNEQDCVSADQLCKYSVYVNISHPFLQIPADMQLVSPTWECKACQYYEWSLQDRMINKSKTLNLNMVQTSGYIKQIIFLNYEIMLAFFWIFLILVLVSSIGFIFIALYWLYLYLRGVGK